MRPAKRKVNATRSDSEDGEAQKLVRDAFSVACDRLSPLRAGANLIVGCSAGGDSMALLELMAETAEARDWRICVAHYDHALRPESAAEAEFVKERCGALGVSFRAERRDISDDDPLRWSESELRNLRFAFFGRAERARQAHAVVLAHHADDRAETFLMRLLSGSGPTGLASIAPVHSVRGLTVVRPLLELRRAELRAFLVARGRDWKEDPSNEDQGYQRVWIRNRLLPQLSERMGADVTARLGRTSQLLMDDSEALTGACKLILERVVSKVDPPAIERFSLKHSLWEDANATLRRRLMREWIWRVTGSPHPPGFEAATEALNFAERGTKGARLRTVGGYLIARESGFLIAHPPEPKRGA